MNFKEVQGYYGSGNTPCTILVGEDRDGGKWYVVEGGSCVNYTYDEIELGVNVEELTDKDCFTWGSHINTLDELEHAIES